MSKLSYFLLCENFIFDKDNRSSIVNIFDIVYATDFPVVPPAFTLAFGLKGITQDETKDGKVNIKVVVTNSKGEELVKANSDQKLDTFPANVVSGVAFGGRFQLTSKGKYNASLEYNGKTLDTLTFEVIPRKAGA